MKQSAIRQPAAPARHAKALTAPLAGWVANLRHRDLPDSTRRAVRSALLDTLGVGLYGLDRPWTRAVRAWTLKGAHPPSAAGALASVWGEPEPSLRPCDAALVNGVSSHAFELDDFHNAKLHPGAAVVPAAVALGEALDASGERLETALAAGYEVMIRTGLALNPAAARLRGWHLTGVCGPLGAAAAGAVLLGLDAATTAWALGLAGTQGSGLFAFNADGAMSKRLHPGRAAHAGILAAELAALGLTGPTQIYEAEDGGLLRAFSDSPRPEALLEGLGAHYCLDATSFKPYACCGSLHAHVDAALKARAALGGPPDPGQRVRAGVGRVVEVQCGYAYEPGTELNAQMSARYCLAVALLEGAVLADAFAPGKLADPAIVELARRIELVHDPKLDGIYPEHFVGWVEVEKGAGEGFERAYVLDPSGSPANPNREAALEAKFRTLMRGMRRDEAIGPVEAAVASLERTTVRDLTARLAALSGPAG